MIRRVLAAAGVIALAVGVASSAGAADDAKTVTITPSTEAWYQPNPTCGLPVGCVTPASVLALLPVPVPVDLPAVPLTVPLSPYPTGTMHVAYTGGRETARAYLTIPHDKLDGEIVSASLEIPLDTSPASGSAVPQNARVQVCTFSSDIAAIEGSIENPPFTLCTDGPELKYEATPKPRLHASLNSIRDALRTTSGIALVPNADAVTATDAWHVAFSTHDRKGATGPAVLTASVRPVAEEPAAEEEIVDELPSFDEFDPGLDSGLDFGSALVPELPVDGDDLGGDVAAPVTPASTTVESGYAYGVVWLLPLVLLLLVPIIARSLTKDLRVS